MQLIRFVVTSFSQQKRSSTEREGELYASGVGERWHGGGVEGPSLLLSAIYSHCISALCVQNMNRNNNEIVSPFCVF